MEQAFLTIPPEVSRQKPEILGSKSEKNMEFTFFGKKLHCVSLPGTYNEVLTALQKVFLRKNFTIALHQAFLTIPLDVSLQKPEVFGSKPKKTLEVNFCRKKIRKFFSGHVHWSFDSSAKNFSPEDPQLFD